MASFLSIADKKQNEETYVFISSATTWNSAQAYCRQYFIDLPMIENSAENNAVISAKPASAEVWIGLYRVPWTWSDKTQSSFRIWQSDAVYPNNYGGNQFCMATNTVPEWDDSNCQSEMPFICHQGDCSTTQIHSFEFYQSKCTVCIFVFWLHDYRTVQFQN